MIPRGSPGEPRKVPGTDHTDPMWLSLREAFRAAGGLGAGEFAADVAMLAIRGDGIEQWHRVELLWNERRSIAIRERGSRHNEHVVVLHIDDYSVSVRYHNGNLRRFTVPYFDKIRV